MPKILILIHGNRFLMNEIKIKLLMKNTNSGQIDLTCILTVLPDICVGVMIQYFIYNNFSVVCKNFNFEIENILENQQPFMASSEEKCWPI